jgi:hypothetical protein
LTRKGFQYRTAVLDDVGGGHGMELRLELRTGEGGIDVGGADLFDRESRDVCEYVVDAARARCLDDAVGTARRRGR